MYMHMNNNWWVLNAYIMKAKILTKNQYHAQHPLQCPHEYNR